jgi:4-amino-4-deoxy-L-arabinose transferase-like glycosyltransferase
MLWLSRHLLGDSVVAIRVFPALAGAATVCLGGWMARELGGGRFAQALAMVAIIVAPLYLGAGGYYSMNGFDVLFWAIAACVLIRILKADRSRLWPLLGLVLGLGLLNKISVLWLGLGLVAGILLTPERRILLTRGPWLAGVLSFSIFLPHLLWQVRHGWPTLEFIGNATTQKMTAIAPVDFLVAQVLTMHPLNLPIWLAGLAWLLVMKDGRRFRILGIIYLTVFLLLVVNRASRPGYLGPAYTMLFGAGGVAVEGWIRGVRPRRLVQGAALALLAAGGAVLAPFALPVLPVETQIRYARFMGIGPSTDERKKIGALPQHYADMFGWDELVATLRGVYDALPPDDRAVAGIFVFNYGEAGAIDLLGRRHGLPLATSGHNNYWLWGPRGYSGQVMIVVGGSAEDHLGVFERVERAGTTDCEYCMPYEDDQPIFVCRGLRIPLDEIWPRLKHYD